MANLAKYLKLRQYMADMMLRHTSEDIPLMSERDMCKSFNVTRTKAASAEIPTIFIIRQARFFIFTAADEMFFMTAGLFMFWRRFASLPNATIS